MRIKTKKKVLNNEDNLLPLVNIIFLLLIFFMLAGVIAKQKELHNVNLASAIIEEYNEDNKNISEIIPLISMSHMYIGNDSFGHHVASQSLVPSFIIILDTPKAYTDYSKNQFRILPDDIDENYVSHDSNISPNKITIDMVFNKIKKFI